MNKLLQMIENMEMSDLKKIKKDLEEGNIRKIIEHRLSELKDDNKVCPVCGKRASGTDYVLQFGKGGIRMKASFDELDCLKHFLSGLESSSSSSA